MERARYIASGLAADVYFPDGISAKGAGIYAYGFPGSIGPNAVTDFLVHDLSRVSVQPHYPGTFDSAGAFSPASAIRGIADTAALVSDAGATNVKNGTPLSIPTPVDILVGHSFGCFPTLRAASLIPSAQDVVLLGPAVTFGDDPLSCGVKEDGDWQLAYVRRSRPFTYRLAPNDEWLSMYAGELNSPERPGSSTDLRQVIGMVGTNDKYFDLALLTERFETIVRLHVGAGPRVSLLIVDQGEHSAASLLSRGKDQLIAALEQR